MDPEASPRPHGRRGMSRVVDQNIRSLLERRAEEQRAKKLDERLADSITRFTGSMRFVYLHLVLFGAWITINLGVVPGVPQFDATFVVLAMIASVEAIFLSTFVLISQNRMAAISDKRADLDLQVSLLPEHEISHLIRVVVKMAERMQIEESADPELKELEKDVRPEVVLERIEATERQVAAEQAQRGG